MSNILYTGDNLYIMNGMNSQSVDLIYLDPPFNSKRTYSAPVGSKSAGASFKDMWSWNDVDEAYLEHMVADYPYLVHYIQSVRVMHGKPMAAYLTYMTQRIIEMKRVLKDTGSLYLHCDPTASHYLKIILDRVFGKVNFRNEIIWCYTGPGSPKMRQFNRKHDVIFWYNKGDTWTFNSDDIRIAHKGGAPHTGGYGITKESAREYGAKGKVPETWWNYAIAPRSKTEYTGYPTQKPLNLLYRIIRASSNRDDVVLDPFCGCATTCVAAQKLDRQWIGIDIEEQAVKVLVNRLSDSAGLFKDFTHCADIPERTDITKDNPKATPIRDRLYKEQGKACNGCSNEYLLKDMETDHIIPKNRGGGGLLRQLSVVMC